MEVHFFQAVISADLNSLHGCLQYIYTYIPICTYTHKDTEETNLSMDKEDAGGSSDTFSTAWTMDWPPQGASPWIASLQAKERTWTALTETTRACSYTDCHAPPLPTQHSAVTASTLLIWLLQGTSWSQGVWPKISFSLWFCPLPSHKYSWISAMFEPSSSRREWTNEICYLCVKKRVFSQAQGVKEGHERQKRVNCSVYCTLISCDCCSWRRAAFCTSALLRKDCKHIAVTQMLDGKNPQKARAFTKPCSGWAVVGRARAAVWWANFTNHDCAERRSGCLTHHL